MTELLRRHTLGDLLRRSRLRCPQKLAVRCGDIDWTYAEFDTICNRLAAGLADEGVGQGDRIAVLARNSHAFAALRFAVARLGAVLVPINFMLNADEARYILGHSGAQRLFVDSSTSDLGRAAMTDTAVQRLYWLPAEQAGNPPGDIADFDSLCIDADGEPVCDIDETMPAQIIYTSGTESRPKGAMLSHRAVVSEYVTCLVDAEIAKNDVILHALPLYHCAQLDVFFGPGIYVGASNVITATPTAENLLNLLQRDRITSFFAPPTVWISLLRSPAMDDTDLSALRKAYYGASIMPVEVLKEIQQRLPELRLWNLYGQTEIAPVATVLKPDEQLSRAGSAGKAALNIETRVVDDAMNDVPNGAIGEVVHRSPQLLDGYYNDPQRTAEAFVGGWFHSGDLATMDAEGYITIVDRKKDMIKTGGENVASREVEEAIYQLEGVAEVAVVGVPHPHWIEAVTAIVVPRAGAGLDPDKVAAHCATLLASYKQPKRIVLVDALPKNPSGKLLKRDLREKFSKIYED